MFGLDRAVAALAPRRDQPLATIAAEMFETVTGWAGTRALEDDFTMVMIRRSAGDTEALP